MQNIILTGFGFMGTMHAQVYQKLQQARIVAVVDINPKKAESTMKKIGIRAPVFTSLETALAKVKSDVVDICLPTYLHTKFALLAINAEKHLFCEKPIALNSSEAAKIIRAANKAGITAQVGHCIRFWPEYVAFKNFVESGKTGKLISLTLQRRSALPSYSMGQWLHDPIRSGGAALDLHIHDTDFVIYLLGLPRGVRSLAPGIEPNLSQIFTQYLYDDIVVTAECGWNYPTNWGFQMAFQAVFENGAIEYDSGANPTLTITLENGKKTPLHYVSPSIENDSTGKGNITSLGGYLNQLQSFIQTLEKKQAPRTATLQDAALSLKVVQAEIKSALTGKSISLPSISNHK